LLPKNNLWRKEANLYLVKTWLFFRDYHNLYWKKAARASLLLEILVFSFYFNFKGKRLVSSELSIPVSLVRKQSWKSIVVNIAYGTKTKSWYENKGENCHFQCLSYKNKNKVFGMKIVSSSVCLQPGLGSFPSTPSSLPLTQQSAKKNVNV